MNAFLNAYRFIDHGNTVVERSKFQGEEWKKILQNPEELKRVQEDFIYFNS